MKEIVILHLYPNEMNTYGDHGNVLTLTKRLKLHGYEPKVMYYSPGDKFPEVVDIVVGGGGQDSAQTEVQEDILKIGSKLQALAKYTPMLLVCGTYQLFGNRFITSDGKIIQGIGIFNIETVGGAKRMIGNIKTESQFGILYGFENHSGKTILAKDQKPFGKVLRGNGNNGNDKTEGAISNDAFGTYMHGPILPNNPKLTDYLIERAATKRYGEFNASQIDDHLSDRARHCAKDRKY